MSSASGRESETKALRDLRFTHWPLRDEPARSLAILCSGLLIAAIVGWQQQSGWLGLLASVALLCCLWRLWLPVQYEFGLRGLSISVLGRTRRVAWRDVAVCEFRHRGVVLYPSRDTSAVASLRSLFIVYPPQRDQLLELLEAALVPKSTRSPSSMETQLRSAGEPQVSSTANTPQA